MKSVSECTQKTYSYCAVLLQDGPFMGCTYNCLIHVVPLSIWLLLLLLVFHLVQYIPYSLMSMLLGSCTVFKIWASLVMSAFLSFFFFWGGGCSLMNMSFSVSSLAKVFFFFGSQTSLQLQVYTVFISWGEGATPQCRRYKPESLYCSGTWSSAVQWSLYCSGIVSRAWSPVLDFQFFTIFHQIHYCP